VSEPLLKMYAVRNRDGQFFRNKGYGGSRSTWVDGLQKARIWPKPGPARSQVTFFATSYPQYGVPELVELRVTEVAVLDESARVQKSIDRKAKKAAERAKRHAEWERDQAERKLKEAQSTLARLGRRP